MSIEKIWAHNSKPSSTLQLEPWTGSSFPDYFSNNEERDIRRLFDEKTETWFFSVMDIVQILTKQPDCR